MSIATLPAHLRRFPCIQPWIGSRYRDERHKRLLVVGDSHYLPPTSTPPRSMLIITILLQGVGMRSVTPRSAVWNRLQSRKLANATAATWKRCYWWRRRGSGS